MTGFGANLLVSQCGKSWPSSTFAKLRSPVTKNRRKNKQNKYSIDLVSGNNNVRKLRS